MSPPAAAIVIALNAPVRPRFREGRVVVRLVEAASQLDEESREIVKVKNVPVFYSGPSGF